MQKCNPILLNLFQSCLKQSNKTTTFEHLLHILSDVSGDMRKQTSTHFSFALLTVRQINI